jgi:hypothetical protein
MAAAVMVQPVVAFVVIADSREKQRFSPAETNGSKTITQVVFETALDPLLSPAGQLPNLFQIRGDS